MKIDYTRINNEKLDKRVKLTKEQRKEVKWMREAEEMSFQKIANYFNVSKSLIMFICKPETIERNLKKRAERGGSKQYYDKEKHRKSTQKHRQYKTELLKKGLI